MVPQYRPLWLMWPGPLETQSDLPFYCDSVETISGRYAALRALSLKDEGAQITCLERQDGKKPNITFLRLI